MWVKWLSEYTANAKKINQICTQFGLREALGTREALFVVQVFFQQYDVLRTTNIDEKDCGMLE